MHVGYSISLGVLTIFEQRRRSEPKGQKELGNENRNLWYED